MNHLEHCVRIFRKRPAASRRSSPGRSSARTPRSAAVVKEEATAVEYLQTLAIARIYLDNFENVQSSWVTQGLKTCQMGLRFGGNDVGSIMIEENVVRAAGVTICTSEEELRRMIRDAGFVPKQREIRCTGSSS